MVRQNILEIEPYIPGKPIEEVEKEIGPREWAKLASNENVLGPSPKAVEAMRAALGQVHFYPDGSFLRLRAALAGRLGVPMEAIICGDGSDEVLKLLAEAFLHEGEEAVLPTPSFVTYRYVVQLMGAKALEVPLKDGAMNLEGMAAAVNPKTKLIVLCNPNNPTGGIVSREKLRSFLAGLPTGVLVVCDEAYFEYADDPDYPDGVDLVREGFPCLVTRTFSKIYGLAGLRIGYGVGNPDLVRCLYQVKQAFPVNLLAQEAAIAALEDVEHLEASRRLNREGKEYLYGELNRLGLAFQRTQANFILVEVNRDGQEVFRGLLAEGMIVRPTHAFGLPKSIRVTIGTAEQNRRFMAALEKVLAFGG